MQIPVNNQTKIAEVLLLGFQDLSSLRILLFVVFLIIYMTILIGNIVIITLVSTVSRLRTPMYFLLCLLSFSEMMSTTNIVPNMLTIIINNGGTVSFTACLTQFYFFSALTNTECFLLTAMSYDRYLAICNPLRYTSMMDLKLCLRLIICSWLLGFTVTFIIINLVTKLHFCGPNIINHFFCDLAPLLKLSCTDTFFVETQAFFFSVPVIIVPFIFITVTYGCIASEIVKMSSTTGRKKALSTCSSHLSVVCTYYGTLISVYLVPSKGDTSNVNKVVSLLYIIVTPLLNPIVYSLRTQEIRVILARCAIKRNTDVVEMTF